MYYQSTPFNCGPAALACAMRAAGRPAGQQALARLAGTNETGTDEDSLKRAMLARNFVPSTFNQSTAFSARNWLLVQLKLGYPVLLCVERWEHWVTCLGLLGDRFIVFDPARFEYRVNTGVSVYPWDRLRRYWCVSKKTRGKSGAYYALGVMRSDEY